MLLHRKSYALGLEKLSFKELKAILLGAKRYAFG